MVIVMVIVIVIVVGEAQHLLFQLLVRDKRS